MAVYELRVDHFLPFIEVDSPTTNIKGCTVTDILDIKDVARSQYIFLSSYSLFNVGHTITVRHSIFNLAVSDFLDLKDKGGTVYNLLVEDNLFLYQSQRTVEYEKITHSILFSQSIDVILAKRATNTLSFTQTIIVNCIRVRTIEDILNMDSEVAIWQPDKYSYSIIIPSITGPNAPEC